MHVPDADFCCRSLVFNAQAAASANCFQCPVGTSGVLSVEVPTAVCTDCEAGTYNNATGRRDCTPCGINQYNNLTGQAKCFPCPRGTVARREGYLACVSLSTTLSGTSTATKSFLKYSLSQTKSLGSSMSASSTLLLLPHISLGSPSMSASSTLVPLVTLTPSATLQCAAEVYRREAVAVDVAQTDEDAVRMYGLHAVANISGLLRLHPSWAATPNGRVPISVLVDVAENQQPNPFGFQALSRVRAEVWMNATASWKERRMDLATPPFPQLSLDVDETILVYALPSAFLFCRPTVPVLILTWTVTAVPEPLAAATRVVAAVVSQSVTAGSVIGGASGGGAAGDVQALATIGMLSCTQPRDRAMLSNTRLLSPAALSNEFVGMLLGNFILIALCALAHYLIVQAYQLVLRRRSSKGGSASTPKASESERTHDTMVCIRYPSLTITVTKVLYQGTALASAQLLASSDGLEVVLGVVGFGYSLALPVVLTMVNVRYVNAEFHTYNIDSPSAQREPLLPSPGGDVEESIAFQPEERKASALVAFVRRFIMPAGVWEPKDARKMYGSLFSSSRRPEIVWVALPLLPSLVLAAASTIHPASTSGCQALFASLACLEFLLVCALLAFWPYRSHCITGLAAASSACLGLVLVGNAIMAEDPGSSSARSLTLWSTQALMVVSVLRMAHVAVLYMFESRLMDSVPRTLAFRLTAVGKAKRLRGEANEDTLDDDEELQHAEATTQQALAVPVADVALPQPTSDPAPVPPPPPHDQEADHDDPNTTVRRAFTHDARSRELYYAVEEMLAEMMDDRERLRLREEEAARERALWEDATDIREGAVGAEAPQDAGLSGTRLDTPIDNSPQSPPATQDADEAIL